MLLNNGLSLCIIRQSVILSSLPRLLWKRLHGCLPLESVWKRSSVSQEAQLLPRIHLWLWRQPLRTVLPTQVHTHTQIKVCVTMWCLCWLFVSIKTLTGCWDVASVLVLHACVESTTSVPGVGGGRPHVDHVTVTQIRASTPTVTRPADTVAARQAAAHTNTCCRLSPSTADLYWECWAGCLLTSWLHVCTYMTANGN